MKGIDEVTHPLIGTIYTPSSSTIYPLFNYSLMSRKSSLHASMLQYPPELLSLLGHCHITDTDVQDIMERLGHNNTSAGSDGSVKDGIVGDSFCISTNTFTNNIWGHAQTVGHIKEMSSLRTDHGGTLGVLILLYAMHIFILTYHSFLSLKYT